MTGDVGARRVLPHLLGEVARSAGGGASPLRSPAQPPERDLGRHPRVLLQTPDRVRVPLLAVRHVYPHPVAGGDQAGPQPLSHAHEHLELDGWGSVAVEQV